MALVSRPWGGRGQGEARGQRRWMAAETEADSVWEKQLSGAAPAIHLTSDQARHEWHYCFTFYILFIHSHTHLRAQKKCYANWYTHTLSNTLKADGVGPWPFLSQFPSFICSWKAVFFQFLWKITEPRPTKGSKTIQKKWINNTMKQNLIKDLHGRFILCRSYTTWPRCISSPGLISRCYTGFVITSLI